MKFLLHASAPAAALALAACSPAAEENDTASAAETATAENAEADTAMAEAAPEGATSAQGFVDQAAASDMFEIESGKLAERMGKSAEIKEFGAKLVADHTKSSNDLKAAAGKAESVTVAPKLTAKQQSDLDALKAAGDQFDATFKRQQVAAHTEALALLEGYAQSGEAVSLKEFAAKTAPVVKQHLEHAQKLK